MKVKATVNSPFQPCELGVFHHTAMSCLQITSDSQKVWVRGHRDELREALQEIIRELQPRGTRIENEVQTITPQQVIHYFYQSPVLASMAEDVKAALENIDTEAGHASDIEIIRSKIDPADLFYNGKPIWGAQKRISEILEIPNAGSYRRNRILPALALLQREYGTTTTTTRPVESRKAA